MRIALFHTTLPEEGRKPGGVEVAVHRLANALYERGEHVTVFSFTEAPSSRKYEHIMIAVPFEQIYRSTASRLLILPWLLNTVDFDDFDVLHLHGDDWFFVRRNIPSIRTLHGSALDEARTAASVKRRISQYVVYLLEHLSCRLATKSAAVGSESSSRYHADFQVHNGVDMRLFYPGKKTDHPSILFVGTWEGRKRGAFIHRVFREEILPKYPHVELYMVSDYCESAYGVRHVIYPSDDVLADLYRRAWLFAYPSVYEGFGIPYIEAMASGTPVICSPNQGARDVLQNGKYGLIREDEDFGDAINDLLGNPQERSRLGEIGLQRAESFSWKCVSQQHIDMYKLVASYGSSEEKVAI